LTFGDGLVLPIQGEQVRSLNETVKEHQST